LAGLRLEWSRTKATPGRLAVAAQRRGMPLDFIPPAPITPLAGEFDQLVDRLLVTVFGPFSQIGQIGCSHHAQHLSNGFGPGRSAPGVFSWGSISVDDVENQASRRPGEK
jgi:hypothetical protein